MHNKNILVLGSYGFLGSRLCTYLKKKKYKVFQHGRSHDADYKFSTSEQLRNLILDNRIGSIVNLVAATNVERCEIDLDYAMDANVYFLKKVISEIKFFDDNSKPFLVHISTDQVYQGSGPHKEESARPMNNYSLTKYFSEHIALSTPSITLRTNFLAKNNNPKKISLCDFIVNSLREGRKIEVFQDVMFNPLHIDTLCQFIDLSLERKICGIYNVGSLKGKSKADLAYSIAKRLNLDTSLMTKIKYSNSSILSANRPLDMRMDCTSFQKKFSLTLPSFDSQVDNVIREYE